MISFDTPTHRFHLRAAAIIRRGGSVLLHCLEGDDFWSLPGGRVEPGEAAAEAVIRELQEELGISARVEHLSLLVENFFTHSEANHHEVGLYFSVHVDSSVLPEDCMTFEGREKFKKLLFRWFPISAIAKLDVRPAILKEHLMQGRSSFRHVVHRAEAAIQREA
jgi:8-oxo-dGTP pyrophosphatase MutT (NUDIX family)